MLKKVFVLFAVTFILSACGDKKVEVEGSLVTYDELQKKIEEREFELNELKDSISEHKQELKEVKGDISSNKKRYDELEKLAKNEEKIKQSTQEMESKINSLETSIKEKQNKLSALEGELVKAEKQPIKINPGYYYFGVDAIAPGRYKVTAQEGQYGNVFIRRDGRSYVAETFGDGKRGSSIREFTFMSSAGDEIEATIPIYLYPVE